MNAPASITITPVLVADLHVEGERMPIYVHVIDHPDARVLVDTGMTELHPALADMDPRLWPLSEQDFDLAGIDIIVNTHLHGDHCGGNHLFTGKPIYVQRRELDDARREDDYTIPEWVDPHGVRYVPVDGELELLRGVRLLPAPGHTRGTQVVVVETGGRPVVIGGDMAVWFGELDEPSTEGQLLVRALDPELVWLAHEHDPWRPPPADPSWLGADANLAARQARPAAHTGVNLTDPARPRHIPHGELELIHGPVTADGGELRQLTGEDYGLVTSVMTSRVVPGSGPRRHRHPYAEIFVLHDGQGRYDVEGTTIDAVAGDLVIVPPNAWHSFTNPGDSDLRHTAVHQQPRVVSEFEDGTFRD
jgi:N-acyl homoserine lactone hydrolase